MLADLVDADGHLPEIQPGVLFEGDDLGRWLKRQWEARTWAQLSEEQQRLSALSITPAEPPTPVPASKADGRAPAKASAAFQRGLTALAQWIEREGIRKAVPRARRNLIVDGQEYAHRLGVRYTNRKQRRDKLTEPQRAALAELGLHWT